MLPWRRPGLALLITATLAVGIGATSSVLGLVRAVLLRPFPFPAADRIVLLRADGPGVSGWFISSQADFMDWQARSRSFAYLAASRRALPILQLQTEPVRLQGADVTADFLNVLGIRPSLGRPFQPGDFLVGAPPVVLISHRLWVERFGADPHWVGRSVSIDGRPQTIAGVLPAGLVLTQPLLVQECDLLLPLPMQPVNRRAGPGVANLRVIGRLRSDVSLPQAAGEMRSLAAMLARESPETNEGITVLVAPLREAAFGNVRVPLLIILGASALVLLAACTNVANLLLIQTALRRRELALRTALGATRLQLFRQLLAESFAYVIPGALLGLLLTRLTWGLFAALVPPEVVQLMGVSLDGWILLVTALVSLLSLGLIHLLPWFALQESSLRSALTESAAASAGGSRDQRTRGLIVAAETALALILLLGAGLLIKSFVNLSRVDLGLRPENRLIADLELPKFRYGTVAPAQALLDETLGRVRTRSGVRSAALMVNFEMSTGLSPENGPPPDWAALLQGVSPGFFETLGVPLLAGRDFAPQDGAEQAVVIVNAVAARRLWPGENAVGKWLSVSWGPPNPREVIGVVGDTRNSLEAPPQPELYLPYQQVTVKAMRLVVRTTGEPLRLAADVRREIRSLDNALPIVRITTLEQLLADRLERPRVYARILAVFAGLALLLAAGGIYGVTAFAVAARRREIGIRMTLGAKRRDLYRMILIQGGRWILLGLVAGLGGAYGLSRWIANLLFEVSPLDPVIFLAVPLLLLGVALCALSIPAREMVRIDPVQALRRS